LITLTATVRDKLAAAFRDALPAEACGLLIGRCDGATFHAIDIALPSGASGAIGQFELSDGEVSRMIAYATGRGLEVVAVFHSHPSGYCGLSETDVAALRYSEWPWLIVTTDRTSRLNLAAFAAGTAERIKVRSSQVA
jgi:proteasome lid subunit RPN8/RPN11